MVVISAPCSREAGNWQERIGTPFACTVHAPHWATPQPYLVPLRSSTSRRIQRRGMSGGTSTVADFPLTLNVTVMGAAPWVPGCSGCSGGDRVSRSTLHIPLQRTRADFRSIDHTIRVGGDSLRRAGARGDLRRVRDERGERAVFGAPDANAALPRTMRR